MNSIVHSTLFRSQYILVLGLLIGFSTAANGFTLKDKNDPATDRGFGKMLMGKGLPKNGNRWPFVKGGLWVTASTSLKLIPYPEFGKVKGMPWLLAGDYSFNDHFAFGIYGGYYAPTYTDPFGSDSYDSYLKSYVAGVRLTFHFADIFNRMFLEVINTRKWDLYATIGAGVVHYEWTVEPTFIRYRDFTPKNFPSASAVLGIRYCPVPRVSVFAELGKGIYGYYGFGVSARIIK